MGFSLGVVLVVAVCILKGKSHGRSRENELTDGLNRIQTFTRDQFLLHQIQSDVDFTDDEEGGDLIYDNSNNIPLNNREFFNIAKFMDDE